MCEIRRKNLEIGKNLFKILNPNQVKKGKNDDENIL